MTERRAIAVHGVVQGVGFRPFVYALARQWGLAGFVRNQAGAVWIEVEGSAGSLDGFLGELTAKSPPLARIEGVQWQPSSPTGESQFRIEPSQTARAEQIFVSPDIAACDDCLADLLNPRDRRFGYPFLNCTNCGPRLTIITTAPYDRPQTTMAEFKMCAACQSEYNDPSNRRFHAQPTCCTACGPQLGLWDCAGKLIETADPLAVFAAALRAGQIGAMKGLGGYHLACDARSRASVAELRRRKNRDDKPFAVMVPNEEAAAVLCEVDSSERELLRSARRPVVILRKRRGCDLAAEVAPNHPNLGLMLPYTPLHHLLMRAVGKIPLVMTSGNRSDEPIAIKDADAVCRLAEIADLFLIHNRPIHVRCDDSVTRVIRGVEMPIRRSRGYAPEPITLPIECSVPILALGGQLKGTFALGRARHAFVSHHLGDLDHYAAYQAFVKDIALYENLFAIEPRWMVHDFHSDYASTRYAHERAEKDGTPLLAVQHHHAHMASCMAEHGLDEKVIGVCFDGTGHGTDGAVWGGEFLVGDYRQFRRAAHLRYVGMPGGDQAIREPWRMALAHLLDAEQTDCLLQKRISADAIRIVRQMLERGFHCPPTSSVGRLFDAVASLAGVRDQVRFEGQAAIELESLATDAPFAPSYAWEVADSQDAMVIDTRPMIRETVADVLQQVPAARIARRFHTTMAEMIVGVCQRLRHTTGLNTVGLSGGVFMNALLTGDAHDGLTEAGFRVYRHRLVPSNDGGLSLGQLAIAAAQQR